MAKYKNEISAEVVAEAEKVAKATQRPGQTKEQTKLIAQGIQKGIEHYKKNHKSKSRELNKKLKTIKINQTKEAQAPEEILSESINQKQRFWILLPWLLLIISWLYFITR